MPTPRTVIGVVTHYSYEKGFGFAEIVGEADDGRPISVFFHKDACRKVAGTADEPQLTNERIEDYVSGRNYTRIVMRIVPTNKGLKAVAWGRVPRRDWRVDAVNSGELDRYLGGTVRSFMQSRHAPGDPFEGRLARVEITPSELTLELRQIADVHGSVKGTQTFTYALDDFARRKSSGNGCTITLDDGGNDRVIMFSLPRSDAYEAEE